YAEDLVDLEVSPGLERSLIKPFTDTHLLKTILLGSGQNKHPLTKEAAWPLPVNMLESFSGKHILLVEDNEINQVVAMDLLQNMGLRVSLAENGEKALKMVECGLFDAILMDIQMPGMDGYQTTAQIRQDPRFNSDSLPIIAMTAHALESDRRKSLEAGLNDYISKPVDITNLANVLHRWLHEGTPKAENEAVTISKQGGEQSVLPAFLESIDMTAALTRLGENKTLYRKLLLMFYTEHSRDVLSIRAAITAGDNELALRMSHSLKGLAGTIGAVDLQTAAKALETIIKKRDQDLFDEYIDRLEQKLALVSSAIALMN
ncbi:MAG: response regulator, partial [Chloroflexota bacterium]